MAEKGSTSRLKFSWAQGKDQKSGQGPSGNKAQWENE